MNLQAVVDGREKGQFPISIGTSLALESLWNVHPELKHDDEPIERPYRGLWINVATLARNIIQALPSAQQAMLTPLDVLPSLIEELNIIDSALGQKTAGRVPPHFYLADYSRLGVRYQKAKLVVARTPKQIADSVLLARTLQALTESDEVEVAIRKYNWAIQGKHPSSLILTHYPVDLLAWNQFANLDLVESHTGQLRSRATWTQRLGKTKANLQDRLAFNAFALQLLGDGNKQFAMQSPKIISAFTQLAEDRKWTPATGPDRMVTGIRTLEDAETRTLLLTMLSA